MKNDKDWKGEFQVVAYNFEENLRINVPLN